MQKKRKLKHILISLMLAAAVLIGLVSVFSASAIQVVIPHRYADEAALKATADVLKAAGEDDSFIVVRYVDEAGKAAIGDTDALVAGNTVRVDFGVYHARDIMGIDMRLKFNPDQVEPLGLDEYGPFNLEEWADTLDSMRPYVLQPRPYGSYSSNSSFVYFFNNDNSGVANPPSGTAMFRTESVELQEEQPGSGRANGLGFFLSLPTLTSSETGDDISGVPADVAAAVPSLVHTNPEDNNCYFNTTAVDEAVYYASAYFSKTSIDPDTFGLYVGNGMEGAWAGVGETSAAARTAFVGFPRPEMTVVSTLVDEGTGLEVGLNIGSGSQTAFSSAGALLRYDPTMMTPTLWTTDETTGEYSALDVPAAADWSAAWSDGRLLPTKSTDNINGRVTEAFTIAGGDAHTAYLYLSAEVAKQITGMEQTLATGEELDLSGEGGGTGGEGGTEPGTGGENPVAEVAETGETGGTTDPSTGGETGGEATPTYPTTTATGKSIQYYTTGDMASEQAVVARFKVLPKDASGALYTMADLAKTLDVVQVTDGMDLKDFPLHVLAGDAVSFITDNSEFSGNEEITTTCDLSFRWIQEGVTVNSGSGPADPSKFASVVFYDWDETLLGSIIVPKGDAESYVNDFTNARIATNEQITKTWDLSTGDDEGVKYQWYSDAKLELDAASLTDSDPDNDRTPKILSNKKGYDFDCWLMNDSETFTAQASSIKTSTDKGVADFKNVTGDMTVKACYKENSTCNAGVTGNPAKYYTMSAPVYNRYYNAAEKTGDYSVKMTIKRENAQGYGVTRLVDPSVRVRVTPDAVGANNAYVWEIYHLDNTDVSDIEFSLPKMARTAMYTVIDASTTAAWIRADVKFAAKTISKNEGKLTASARNDLPGTDGWVKDGTLAYMNEQCIIYLQEGTNAGWTGRCDRYAFQDAGLTDPVGSTITATEAKTYRSKIEAAIGAKGNQPLTYDEMRAALGLPAVAG